MRNIVFKWMTMCGARSRSCEDRECAAGASARLGRRIFLSARLQETFDREHRIGRHGRRSSPSLSWAAAPTILLTSSSPITERVTPPLRGIAVAEVLREEGVVELDAKARAASGLVGHGSALVVGGQIPEVQLELLGRGSCQRAAGPGRRPCTLRTAGDGDFAASLGLVPRRRQERLCARANKSFVSSRRLAVGTGVTAKMATNGYRADVVCSKQVTSESLLDITLRSFISTGRVL
jgi:hypothetical protein